MHTHMQEKTTQKAKKDYSRCFAPEFEEVCDRAEELAGAEGETREGVLSMIRHPGWGILPPQLEAFLPWAREMRRKAAARITAEREQEKREQENKEEERREQEKKEQERKEEERKEEERALRYMFRDGVGNLRSAVGGFVFSPPGRREVWRRSFPERGRFTACDGARSAEELSCKPAERRKRPAPNFPAADDQGKAVAVRREKAAAKYSMEAPAHRIRGVPGTAG